MTAPAPGLCACGEPLPAVGRFSKCAGCLLGAAAEREAVAGLVRKARVGGVYSTPERKPRPRGATPESLVLHAVEAALAKLPGCIVWRNSVGFIKQPRPFSYGLGKGSADLVGIVTVAGRGLFLALEVKAAEGVVAPHQQAWLDRVRNMGGVAAVVRSALDAVRVVTDAQAGRGC